MFTSTASDHFANYAQRLGEIFDVASRSATHGRAALLTLRSWTVPAVELKQATMFYNERGRAVAYFTWAYLTERTAKRLQTEPLFVPNRHEWLEGSDFWIIDLAANEGSAAAVIRYIRNVVAVEAGEINYLARVRPGGSGRLHRVVKRRLVGSTRFD